MIVDTEKLNPTLPKLMLLGDLREDWTLNTDHCI